MIVRETGLAGVLAIEPTRHRDERGAFQETWQAERYASHGIPPVFVQDCVSWNRRGVVRGLHLQLPRAQGKLVCVLHGEVWDVVVDVRRGSPTFGRWIGATLSEENAHQVWIPPGFAHGFAVLGDGALFSYKTSAAYDPGGQVAIRWNDPALGIEWPIADPVLSDRDAAAQPLSAIDPALLPDY